MEANIAHNQDVDTFRMACAGLEDMEHLNTVLAQRHQTLGQPEIAFADAHVEELGYLDLLQGMLVAGCENDWELWNEKNDHQVPCVSALAARGVYLDH